MQVKKTYFGENCLKKSLSCLIKHYQPQNIFLVTGQKSYQQAKAILDTFQVNFIHFNDFEQNPKIEDVAKGIERYQNHPSTMTIALGGGSALDTAKLIHYFKNREALEDYLKQKYNLYSPHPLIAIPTTAGTGSEATHFSVLYINKIKYSVTDNALLPHHVILDPALTHNLPPAITASTGLDALTQAIESYWATEATPQSQRFAKSAIKLCLSALEKAVNHPDKHSRAQMMLAAFLAGKAINISKTTAPHAFSYALTTHYGIPHGHAVALTLPIFMALNGEFADREINEKRGKLYLGATLNSLYQLLGHENAKVCAQFFKSFVKKLGLKADLRSLNITDYAALVKVVNLERMANNPVKLSSEDILSGLDHP